MDKSALTFELWASSLIMLAIIPYLNNNNNLAIAQDPLTTTMAMIIVIANTQPTITNMNGEQVYWKDSL